MLSSTLAWLAKTEEKQDGRRCEVQPLQDLVMAEKRGISSLLTMLTTCVEHELCGTTSPRDHN